MSLHSCPKSQCTPRVNPNVNYGLWMIMMCQCVFIYCNKYTAFMEDVVNGGSCACMGSESIWEISVSFALYQFFCAPNIENLNKAKKNYYEHLNLRVLNLRETQNSFFHV